MQSIFDRFQNYENQISRQFLSSSNQLPLRIVIRRLLLSYAKKIKWFSKSQLEFWISSHLCCEGHPSSIHRCISEALHLTERPKRIGRGKRPAAFKLWTWRSDTLSKPASSFAAKRPCCLPWSTAWSFWLIESDIQCVSSLSKVRLQLKTPSLKYRCLTIILPHFPKAVIQGLSKTGKQKRTARRRSHCNWRRKADVGYCIHSSIGRFH